jgi:hypothetical protein
MLITDKSKFCYLGVQKLDWHLTDFGGRNLKSGAYLLVELVDAKHWFSYGVLA